MWLYLPKLNIGKCVYCVYVKGHKLPYQALSFLPPGYPTMKKAEELILQRELKELMAGNTAVSSPSRKRKSHFLIKEHGSCLPEVTCLSF